MNPIDRDLTQAVRSWIRTEEPASADRIVDAVLAAVEESPRRRSWLGPWLSTTGGPIPLGLASVIVLIVAVVAMGMLTMQSWTGAPPPSASPSAPASPSATPVPEDVLDVPLASSANTVTVAGIRLSFSVPSFGWESHGRPYISKSTRGPQGAEAIVYWAGFPESVSATPCALVLGSSIGSTAADLATAVSIAPGTQLVADVSDVVVGGLPAKHMVLTVQEDYGCDPGFFYTWDPFLMGALWPEVVPGDTIRVWIVGVGDKRIFIAGATHQDAGARVAAEIEQIIESITFD